MAAEGVSGDDGFGATDNERALEEMILKAPVPLCRNAARSAINYLRRAWRIREIDPPLAMFCCITAEEEAVRAIFHSLHRHGYAQSDKLNWHNHRQKAVVAPFLYAIGEMLRDLRGFSMSIVPSDVGGRKQLRLRALGTAPNGQAVAVYPDPPLHGTASVDGQAPELLSEMTKAYGGSDLPNLRKAMRVRANERNQWLYATEKGLPGVTGPIDAPVALYRQNVFTLLVFFILVDEHASVQGLAQQALTEFLRVLDELR